MVVLVAALSVALSADKGTQTKATDKVPPFSLTYFVGEWTFDWTSPESAIGPAGDMVGKETFRLLGRGQVPQQRAGYADLPSSLFPRAGALLEVLESWIEGTGPAGSVMTRTVMTHDPASGKATRSEVDKAGKVLTKQGAITGDLGGIYSFTWETAPFDDGGRRLRLRGRTVAFSPHNYRDFIQIAVDDGDFVTYGQPWFRKAEP